MIKYENHCCDCAVPGYPCLGNSCPRINVPVYYCDWCNNDTYAEHDIEGDHYCGDCAKAYLKDVFDNLTLSEQAELLDINMKGLID